MLCEESLNFASVRISAPKKTVVQDKRKDTGVRAEALCSMPGLAKD